MPMDSPSTDLPDQPVAEVPDKKSAHRLSLTRIDKRFTALFSILAKLFFIVLIVLAMVFVTRELLSQEYVIQQVSVPERFEKAGYTGPVVAQLIAQQVHDIIFASRKVEFVEEYKSSLDVNELSVDMVGLGVPIRSVIEMLGKAIGVDRKRKINTIITEEAGKIVLTVLISGGVSDRMELPLSDNSNPPMKKLISEVSEVILKHTNENVLVPYYVQVTGELDKEIELYKFLLDKHFGDSINAGIMYVRWSRALLELGQREAAEQKLELAIANNPKEPTIYLAQAEMARKDGDYLRAIQLVNRRMNMRQVPTSGDYSNLGLIYSYAGVSDSAIHYYNKAIESDPDAAISYYNLSYEFLIKGDTGVALDYLERSFARSFSVSAFLKDPDMKSVVNHPRVKSMMLKYRP